MKRKVIQLAGKTLVVSLPSKWASKYKIKKGDEIEAEEVENRLVISQNNELVSEKVQVDVSGLSSEAANRILGATYKAGYDEAEIRFGSYNELDTLLDVVREGFVGFEIVNKAKNSITLRNVAVIQYGEFENILRRIFLVVLSMAEEGFEALKTNSKLLLKSVIFMDKDVNKYANFCRRMLNKKGYSKFQKTPPIYYVVEQLEKTADVLRDICIYAQKTSTVPSKDIFETYSKLCAQIRAIYELYYRFDKDRVNVFFNAQKELKGEIFEKIKTSKGHNTIYLVLIAAALENCFDMSGPIITLSL